MVLHVALPVGNLVSLEVPWKQVDGTLAGLVILSKEALQKLCKKRYGNRDLWGDLGLWE